MRINRYHRANTRPAPKAEAIARAITENAAILALRTTRLVADIRARFGVGDNTARAALELARQRA